MILDSLEKSNWIKREALRIGFSSCSITEPSISKNAKNDFKSFLSKNYFGQMNWMNERVHFRLEPKLLWKEVKSVVVLSETYLHDKNVLENLDKKNKGNISIYARGDDYHKVMKKRLKKLAQTFVSDLSCQVKVFVDTAPVLEKVLARQSGLGWTGKHTNLVSRDLGNWFFIGLIFTDLNLNFDKAEDDHCGNCRACVDSCPTNAFTEPYRLDARKCISYLTIEHKGPIELSLRGKLGNRIYGCDDCLAACPWNKFAKKSSEIRYSARQDFESPDLHQLVLLDDASFREKFSGSPVKRIGRDRFLRNVLYAIGNSKMKSFLPVIEKVLVKEEQNPTIFEAALWAKGSIINGCQ